MGLQVWKIGRLCKMKLHEICSRRRVAVEGAIVDTVQIELRRTALPMMRRLGECCPHLEQSIAIRNAASQLAMEIVDQRQVIRALRALTGP